MSRGHPWRARSGSLAAAGLVLAVATGCGTHETLGPEPVRHDTVSPHQGDCVGRVDALIDARTIPRSDREYAISMCDNDR